MKQGGPRLSKGPSTGRRGPNPHPGRSSGQAGWRATHQGAELHDQQVGCHLGTLGQALEQVAVLQGPVGADRLPPDPHTGQEGRVGWEGVQEDGGQHTACLG